jgi:hypothetical protein
MKSPGFSKKNIYRELEREEASIELLTLQSFIVFLWFAGHGAVLLLPPLSLCFLPLIPCFSSTRYPAANITVSLYNSHNDVCFTVSYLKLDPCTFTFVQFYYN